MTARHRSVRRWLRRSITDTEDACRAIESRVAERLELIHAVGNTPSCRVADKAGYPLATMLPPAPPEFPDDGHPHVRLARS
jgi:hypothetical protein